MDEEGDCASHSSFVLREKCVHGPVGFAPMWLSRERSAEVPPPRLARLIHGATPLAPPRGKPSLERARPCASKQKQPTDRGDKHTLPCRSALAPVPPHPPNLYFFAWSLPQPKWENLPTVVTPLLVVLLRLGGVHAVRRSNYPCPLFSLLIGKVMCMGWGRHLRPEEDD